MTADPNPQARLGDPVAPPHRDLSGAFNPALRTALPTRTQKPRRLETDKPPEPETEVTAPTPTAAQRGKGKAKSAEADSTLTTGRVVYLPDPVRDALGVACAEQHKTRTVLVLEAIEATYEVLGDLVAQDLAPKVTKGKLWDSVVTPTRRDQPPKRQVFIGPTHAQVQVIDDLVTSCGARDRSHLVSVALSAHLGLAHGTDNGKYHPEGTS